MIDEEDLIVQEVTYSDAFSHFFTIFWKVFFALIPPTSIYNGIPTFFVALTMIGVVTFIVGELATVLGCSAGIPESVAAITLVALGTSLPDTFASMSAARSSETADAAIANITGSNSVNVFVGLGLPWLYATYHHLHQPDKPGKLGYEFPSGDLSFSVSVFLMVAAVCFIILLSRRYFIGGELGGPPTIKYASGIALFSLWFIYILLSILQASGVIFPKEEE